jgi:hypothetical protein
MCDHPNAESGSDAIKVATAGRGGMNAIDGVIFRTDRG